MTEWRSVLERLAVANRVMTPDDNLSEVLARRIPGYSPVEVQTILDGELENPEFSGLGYIPEGFTIAVHDALSLSNEQAERVVRAWARDFYY